MTNANPENAGIVVLDDEDDEMVPCMRCSDEFEEGELEDGLCHLCVDDDDDKDDT